MAFGKLALFTSIFAKKKLEQAGRSITEGLATWDPERASEAEMEMMIGKFEGITGKVAKAKTAYIKEQKEADAAEAEFEKLLKTAEKIQVAMETAEGDELAELEEALSEVCSTLEELKPEVEREVQEAAEAKEILVELEAIAESFSKKLKTAKDTLAKGRRDMEKAKIREERAKDREESAKELAGLKNSTDELGSALSAFERQADKANSSAEASELRTKLLKPTEKPSSKVIDKFRSEVEGTGKPTNAADRLAALRK